MANFHVPLKKVVDDSYDIEIGRDLFQNLIDDLNKGLITGASKFAVITDSNVEALYADKLMKLLADNGYKADLFSFPAGEASKTRQTKIDIEDRMLDKLYGRDSAVIALGGGVVSDLAGFLAGTFGRGIPFINYSTTMLSAADASVGGKTAVDTPVATNLIGLFNQPKKVYIDIDTWKTLPVREVACGLAETVKHACLADAEFFTYLEENVEKVISNGEAILDTEVTEYIAMKNCETKYKVVAADERESNFRQVLNLGHTGGRSLETLCEFKLLHGEAVSIGLIIQAALGQDLGFMTEAEVAKLKTLLERCALPVEVPDYVSSEDLVIKMRTDKKVRSGEIRFVFQDGIGAMKTFDNGSYALSLEEPYILEVMKKMRGEI